MNKETEQIMNHAIQEGYNRAMELLQLCSKAQVIMERANLLGLFVGFSFADDAQQWVKDFTAYLKIQTGDNDAS